ncbi:Tetratricopeptide repeat-like superfamily protein [Prunus dulcis]|uniref:Tetratricopeptide repeat-like superfamily protein n=1 Tax=Prunus dulcis TaxID=3755 RepID=A0A4Y1R1R8_PRUDU|nr:Tetratricopeptide repeat-like superfamily protein [Prunus dulcis]
MPIVSVPHPLSSSSSSKSSHSISFPSLTKPSGSSGALADGFVHRLVSSGSSSLKGRNSKQLCRANFDDFSYEELSKQIEDLAQNFNLSEEDDEESEEEPPLVVSKISKTSPVSMFPEGENSKSNGFSLQSSSLKLNALEPSLLGIHPEPPDWPERNEIVRATIERKANSLEFPMSLRLIKKKHRQWEESPRGEAGEFTSCSLNKAFSSMVFIVRELHSSALSIRESLYSEDLQEIVAKVFSKSPTLMVYVMVLLANFTVYSMNNNAAVAAIPLPVITEIFTVTEKKEQPNSKSDDASEADIFSVTDSNGVVKRTSNEGVNGDGGDKVSPTSSIKMPLLILKRCMEFTTEEEVKLWNSVVEEASRMQAELRDEALDHETLQQFVSPVTVNVEPDYYDEYFRTDVLYQIGLAKEPDNALLLSNYAQFLYVVMRDHDRLWQGPDERTQLCGRVAEQCFRRAVQGEKPDAEAVSRYADFLWIVRKDLWGAEERYQQAMATEPCNPYYASKYANFLWSTGGEDTCFPLDTSYDNYNQVL